MEVCIEYPSYPAIDVNKNQIYEVLMYVRDNNKKSTGVNNMFLAFKIVIVKKGPLDTDKHILVIYPNSNPSPKIWIIYHQLNYCWTSGASTPT